MFHSSDNIEKIKLYKGFFASFPLLFSLRLTPRIRACHLTILCTLSRAYHPTSEDSFAQLFHDIWLVFRQYAQKYFSSAVHLFLNFVHLLSRFSTVTRFLRFCQTSDVRSFSESSPASFRPFRAPFHFSMKQITDSLCCPLSALFSAIYDVSLRHAPHRLMPNASIALSGISAPICSAAATYRSYSVSSFAGAEQYTQGVSFLNASLSKSP